MNFGKIAPRPVAGYGAGLHPVPDIKCGRKKKAKPVIVADISMTQMVGVVQQAMSASAATVGCSFGLISTRLLG